MMSDVSVHEKAFGAVLKKARESEKLSRSRLSQQLGIITKATVSSIKSLENGTLLPSDRLIVPLFQNLGQEFSWEKFQQLVSALQIVRASRQIEQEKHLTSLKKIMMFFFQNDPSIHHILELSNLMDITVSMQQYLTDKPKDDNHNLFKRQSLQLSILEHLPPIYRDLVENTIQDLGQFPPHVNSNTLSNWENKNSSRIREVYALISDIDVLIHGNNFHWPFLKRGDYSAKVNLVILQSNKKEAQQKISHKINQFKRILKSTSEDIQIDQIRYIYIEYSYIISKIESLLYFDLFRRSSCTYDQIENYDSMKDRDRIMKFNNIWLFRMDSHIKEANCSNNFIDVAFLDNYSKEHFPKSEPSCDPAPPHYAVSTSYSHTEEIVKVLKAAFHVNIKNIYPRNTSFDWESHKEANLILVVSLNNIDKYIKSDTLVLVSNYFHLLFDRFTYLIGDSYYITSLYITTGKSKEECKTETTKECKRFIELINYQENSYLLSSDIRKKPEFSDYLKKVQETFNANDMFAQVIKKDAKEYVDRQQKNKCLLIDKEEAVSESINYLLDEIAIYAMLKDMKYEVELYPGNELNCINAIIENKILGDKHFLINKFTISYEVRE